MDTTTCYAGENLQHTAARQQRTFEAAVVPAWPNIGCHARAGCAGKDLQHYTAAKQQHTFEAATVPTWPALGCGAGVVWVFTAAMGQPGVNTHQRIVLVVMPFRDVGAVTK